MGQLLTALGFSLDVAREQSLRNGDSGHESLEEPRRVLDLTFEELRRIIVDLRPRALDELGLLAAIRWYAREFLEQTGITVTCQLDTISRQDPEIETSLYVVLQEAGTNIIRHAKATRVAIRLHRRENGLRLSIEDNGGGLANAVDAKLECGSGLDSMRQRIALIGGILSVESMPEGGCRVTADAPIRKAN